MPRQASIDAHPPRLSPPQADDGGQAPAAIHHIIFRGIERRTIFRAWCQRNCFCQRIEDLAAGSEYFGVTRRARAQMACSGASLAVLAGDRFATLGFSTIRGRNSWIILLCCNSRNFLTVGTNIVTCGGTPVSFWVLWPSGISDTRKPTNWSLPLITRVATSPGGPG
jgi:hypothetical protein